MCLRPGVRGVRPDFGAPDRLRANNSLMLTRRAAPQLALESPAGAP